MGSSSSTTKSSDDDFMKTVLHILRTEYNISAEDALKQADLYGEDFIREFQQILSIRVMNNTTNSTETTQHQYSYEQYIVLFLNVFLPTMCLIGFFGNGMVWVLIQSHRQLRKLPSNVYLLALSASSAVYLGAVFMDWTDRIINFETTRIFNSMLFICKFSIILIQWTDFLAVWMIVLVAYERFQLLRVNRVRTTKKTAYIQVLIMSVLALLLTGTGGIKADLSSGTCTWNSAGDRNQTNVLYVTYETVSLVGGFIIPSILIVVLNLFVVRKLKHHMRRRGTGTVTFDSQVTSINNQNATTLHPNSARLMVYNTNSASAMNATSTGSYDSQNPRSYKLRRTELDLTRSLLIVTTTFVILNAPNNIYRLVNMIVDTKPFFGGVLYYELIVRVLCLGSLYMHHAILFYLYIFYSPQMKKYLRPTAMQLLECYCMKPVPEFGHEQNNSRQIYQQREQQQQQELINVRIS